eukprot:scpid44240/ scgid33177/ 
MAHEHRDSRHACNMATWRRCLLEQAGSTARWDRVSSYGDNPLTTSYRTLRYAWVTECCCIHIAACTAARAHISSPEMAGSCGGVMALAAAAAQTLELGEY